jgi:hypothetical protein
VKQDGGLGQRRARVTLGQHWTHCSRNGDVETLSQRTGCATAPCTFNVVLGRTVATSGCRRHRISIWLTVCGRVGSPGRDALVCVRGSRQRGGVGFRSTASRFASSHGGVRARGRREPSTARYADDRWPWLRAALALQAHTLLRALATHSSRPDRVRLFLGARICRRRRGAGAFSAVLHLCFVAAAARCSRPVKPWHVCVPEARCLGRKRERNPRRRTPLRRSARLLRVDALA